MQLKIPIKTLFLLTFIFFAFTARATNYYLSNSGNDANSGTDPSSPWQTLNKLNSFKNLKPGDNVLFKRGDTFYGSITVNTSGTAGNPITFSAYGTGENPVITGFTTITGWTNEGGGIYSKAITAESATNNIVMVDGVNTAMGRWPNTGYMTYESHSGNTSITDDQLTGTPNWTGAELVLRRTQWTLNRNLITNHVNTTITYTPASDTWDGPTDGYGYFIQNSLSTLDTLHEWYYNGTYLYMYFGADNPDSSSVKMSTLDQLFSVGTSYSTRRNYITIDGLTFEGSSISSIYLAQVSGNIIIQNCTIQYGGQNGIFAYQNAHLLINNNIINQMNNNAIDAEGTGSDMTIINDTITNIGILAGMGGNAGNDDNAYDAIINNFSGIIIEHNTIQHVGHSGIRTGAVGSLIQNNNISDWGLVRSDCGAIYTSQADSVIISENIVINSNKVLDGIGIPNRPWIDGIYLDDYTTNSTISNNSVYNVEDNGIMINGCQNIEVFNNTVYACDKVQLLLSNHTSGTQISGLNIHDNIFVAKMAGNTAHPYNPLVAQITSDYNSPTTFGTFDNNYYARPIDDSAVFRRYDVNSGDPWNGTGLTLAQWQSYSGQDAHSHSSPKAISDTSDLAFEYNSDSTSKTIVLPYNYMDITGATYNGAITLAPFTSAVLMENGAIIINQLPKANAGANQSITLPTNTVTLSGSGSDSDGTITSFQWTKISGPSSYNFTNLSSAVTTVSGFVQGVYQFELKATDNKGAVGKDTVQITVNAAPNMPPTANASADKTITLPTNSVSLSGSGTDSDGAISSYAWTKISGPSAYSISSSSSAATTVSGLV